MSFLVILGFMTKVYIILGKKTLTVSREVSLKPVTNAEMQKYDIPKSAKVAKGHEEFSSYSF